MNSYRSVPRLLVFVCFSFAVQFKARADLAAEKAKLVGEWVVDSQSPAQGDIMAKAGELMADAQGLKGAARDAEIEKGRKMPPLAKIRFTDRSILHLVKKGTRMVVDDKFRYEVKSTGTLTINAPAGIPETLLALIPSEYRYSFRADGRVELRSNPIKPLGGRAIVYSLSRPPLSFEGETPRTWISTAGSELEATLVGFSGTVAILKGGDGKEMRVPVSKLKAEDREYIRAAVEKAKAGEK